MAFLVAKARLAALPIVAKPNVDCIYVVCFCFHIRGASRPPYKKFRTFCLYILGYVDTLLFYVFGKQP